GLMVAMPWTDKNRFWLSEPLVSRRLHPKVLRPEYIGDFLRWAAQMHFLENPDREQLSFSHLKLRHWLASQGLPTLLHSTVCRRQAVRGVGRLGRTDGIPSLIPFLHSRSVWSCCRDRLLECCIGTLNSILSDIFIPELLTILFTELFLRRLE